MAFSPFKKSQVKPLTVKIEGESVVVYYRPYAMTVSDLTEFAEKIGSDDLSGAEKNTTFVKLLAKLITKIDWVDENGAPYGVSEEIFNELPSPIFNALALAVLDAVKNGGTSDPKEQPAI